MLPTTKIERRAKSWKISETNPLITMKKLTAMNMIGFTREVLYNKDDFVVCSVFLIMKIPQAQRMNQKYSDTPKYG